jgi:hypothetical protein
MVGGAVSGVAGLSVLTSMIWFVLRRRRHRTAIDSQGDIYQADGDDTGVHQFGDTQRAHEVADKVTYAHERELPAQAVPAELATSRE